MGQRTNTSIVLRFGSQAIRRASLPLETILTKAGVALNKIGTNERTSLSAQHAFWAAAEVSRDPALRCISVNIYFCILVKCLSICLSIVKILVKANSSFQKILSD